MLAGLGEDLGIHRDRLRAGVVGAVGAGAGLVLDVESHVQIADPGLAALDEVDDLVVHVDDVCGVGQEVEDLLGLELLDLALDLGLLGFELPLLRLEVVAISLEPEEVLGHGARGVGDRVRLAEQPGDRADRCAEDADSRLHDGRGGLVALDLVLEVVDLAFDLGLFGLEGRLGLLERGDAIITRADVVAGVETRGPTVVRRRCGSRGLHTGLHGRGDGCLRGTRRARLGG